MYVIAAERRRQTVCVCSQEKEGVLHSPDMPGDFPPPLAQNTNKTRERTGRKPTEVVCLCLRAKVICHLTETPGLI